jgi:hypothetical protein
MIATFMGRSGGIAAPLLTLSDTLVDFFIS